MDRSSLDSATGLIDAAPDVQALVDATVAAIAPFGFRDAVIARLELREGFPVMVRTLATFDGFLEYVNLRLPMCDPAEVISQTLVHPTLMPLDLLAWRDLTPEQAAALAGPLGRRIGTRLFLPGTRVEGAVYAICFSGGGDGAGEEVGDSALLWAIGRVAVRRLAQLEGHAPHLDGVDIPVARLLRPARGRGPGPQDSGAIARQRRVFASGGWPTVTIVHPTAGRETAAEPIAASSAADEPISPGGNVDTSARQDEPPRPPSRRPPAVSG